MRDHLLCYVNGKRNEIRGERAFSSLADFLRSELRLTGTKVVCAEGDCGACTVLVGRPEAGGLRYLTVDACIQFLYQLDGSHVISVEGLAGADAHVDAVLHPVQRAMVDCHGSQCGYCTPGFVMALAGWCEQSRRDLRTELTGNLCRCTGYVPILEAAASVDPARVRSLAECYSTAEIARDLQENTQTAVLVRGTSSVFFGARSLEEALDFKVRHPEATIVSGGTELGVLRNKLGLVPPALLSLTHVPGLAEITCANDTLQVGANVTWTQIEMFAREKLPELHRVAVRFGSPQIRNVATLVGNIAHGSPIADALPFLYVMEADLELASRAGTRRVGINKFYKGYKLKDLGREEVITQVRIPLPAPDEALRLYKVSRRNDLDIATFGAAVRVQRSGDMIECAWLAYSGVGPTVVRLPKTETYLKGQPFAEETFQKAGALAAAEIEPISDVRGARDHRLQLAKNILLKFWFDCEEPHDVPVRPGASA